MGRVIFVGMHNKPDKLPLCPSTMSGKIISRVIEGIGCEAIRTNLCDCDHKPSGFIAMMHHNTMWNITHSPTDSDIIVLLGQWVHDNFIKQDDFKGKIIKAAHPASTVYHAKPDEYIANLVQKIKQFTNP